MRAAGFGRRRAEATACSGRRAPGGARRYGRLAAVLASGYILLAPLCAGPATLPTAAAQTELPAGAAALRARIDAALLRLSRHAVAAVRVVALDRGTTLYERNADLALNPASNMKLLTSAAALARLGPDYRFTTRVLATERPDRRGRVSGELILQGGGDPVLAASDLERLAEAVRAAGVRHVRGALLADDRRYDAQRLGFGWNWDDEPYYYSAQVSALSVGGNVLTLEVRPTRAGEPAEVRVEPIEGYLAVAERPRTGPAGSTTRLEAVRERGRNVVRVTGTIAEDAPPSRTLRVTMEEPALCAAALFRKLLEARGVRIDGPVRALAAASSTANSRHEGEDRVLLAEHVSPPLADILPRLNKPSDNLIAEMLIKELGRAAGAAPDAPGSWETGTAAVEAWLREIGIDTGGVRINDGSGLSRLDLVTARAISDLLVWVDRQPWRDVFVRSLPVAGVDGTLRNRLRGTAAAENVRAKTGSLLHVTALSGYATGAAGERLAFSILVNHHPGPLSGPGGPRSVEDAIALALAEYRAEENSRAAVQRPQ